MTLQPVGAMPIDADLWWIVYLRGALVGRSEPYAQGVKFDREVPNPRPSRLVSVRYDGGGSDSLFAYPRISLDVWSDTQKNATDLSNLLIALAKVAPLAGVGCVRVIHESGPTAIPDPSGQPRRLSLIEATHRATIL